MRLRGCAVLGDAVDEQPLLPGLAVGALGDADERQVAEAELLELPVHFVDLAQSAVDQQQVRRRDLAGADARVAPLERLAQRAVVIARRDAA